MTDLLERLGAPLPLRRLARERTFTSWVAILTLVVLVNLAWGGFWTYPRWQASGQARVDQARIEAASERLAPVLQGARQRYGPVLAAERDLAALRKRIAVQGGTTAAAVDALHRAVAEAGLQRVQIRYQDEIIDELGLLELQATLPVTGSYASLRQLISALGSDAAFTAIDSIRLASGPGAGSAGPLTIEVALSTFVADPEADDPGPTANGAASTRQRGAASWSGEPSEVVEDIQTTLASLPPPPRPPDDYDIDLENLDRPHNGSSASTRNLFAFESQPAPGPDLTPAPAPAQQPPPAATPPPPPRVAFQLIGIVDMPSGRRATLVDGGGLHVVVAGDQLPGGIRVASVGMDYVELEVRGTLVRLTLEIESP